MLFIVVPIAELYVIIKVGEAIGCLPTLAILLADALLGSLLLRHQGRSAWRRFNKALEERRFPGREVADGVAITVGGTLLLTPGFITDIFGLILLIPPRRAVVRRLGWSFIGWRYKVVGGAAGWGYERMRRSGRPKREPRARRPAAGTRRPYDVEGTAHEVPANGTARSSATRRRRGRRGRAAGAPAEVSGFDLLDPDRGIFASAHSGRGAVVFQGSDVLAAGAADGLARRGAALAAIRGAAALRSSLELDGSGALGSDRRETPRQEPLTAGPRQGALRARRAEVELVCPAVEVDSPRRPARRR